MTDPVKSPMKTEETSQAGRRETASSRRPSEVSAEEERARRRERAQMLRARNRERSRKK